MTLDGVTKVVSRRVEPVAWLLAVLTLAAPVFAAQAKDTERDWLEGAKAAEQAREFDRAAECYSSFLKDHPGRADVWQRLGLAYYLGNRLDRAVPALERASQLDATLWAADLFLGISESRMSQFASAQVALERALATKPDIPEGHFWLGSTLMALGKHEEAMAELEKVPPDSSVAMDADYQLARGYRRVAEEYYERIQKSDANSYRGHQLAAEAFAWKGEYQNAVLEYRKALQLRPDLEGAHRGIAEMCWEQRQYERATQEYEAELQNYPLDDQAHLRIGEYRLAEGRILDAITELAAAHQVNTTSWETCRALGQAWMAGGDPAKAQALLEAAVQNNPADALSHKLLAEAYRATGRPELAEREQGIFRKLSAAEGN
jgi:tetratricopeptide (TPR) repeat protein